MKVALFAFLVRRSIDSEISVTVPLYEAELLSAIHGQERVKKVSEDVVGAFEIENFADERERLRMKYGHKSDSDLWVDTIFPTSGAFEQAVQQCEYQEPQEDDDSPYSGNTRDELKAILDSMSVKYTANASKAELLKLVLENAPPV